MEGKSLRRKKPRGEEGNDKRDLPKDGNNLEDVNDPKNLDQSTNNNDLTTVPESINPMVEKGGIPSLEKDGKCSTLDTKEKEMDISIVLNS